MRVQKSYIVASLTEQYYLTISINGKFALTEDIDKAQVFKNEASASKAMIGMHKKLRQFGTGWKVIEIERKFEDGAIKYQAKLERENKANMSAVHGVDFVKVSDFISLCSNTDNLQMLSDKLQEIYDNYQKYCDLAELYERQRCDILHKLENDNFNACGGYRWAKMLKDICIKRREAKNAIRFIERTQGSKDISVVINELNAIKNLKYCPRALPELF